jgi:ketosteroid isomerase-like protein
VTMAERVPDVVRRYFAAVNGDRFDDLRDVFAPDVVLEMAGSARRDGVDAALGYYPRALSALPVHDDEPVSVLTSDDGRRIAVEIAFTGTTTDGRPVVFAAVDLFDVDEQGRVARLRSFYDTNLVAAALRPPG